MKVRVNDQVQEFAGEATLAEALRRYGVSDTGVAVALDGNVVPRADWPNTTLHEDATIEVLTAVQGG